MFTLRRNDEVPKGIPRDKSTQRKILHRLKIARGHLNKVIQMVEEGEYCLDIVGQSRAVQNALREADLLTLQNHLQTCVVEQIKSGDAKTSIEEIIKVLKNNK